MRGGGVAGCARAVALAGGLAAFAVPGVAQVLSLPEAAVAAGSRQAEIDDHAFAVGPWRDGATDVIEAEGTLVQTAWHLPAEGLSTMEMMVDLRAQIEAAGFEVLFECRTRSCGGFDFRFALDLLPEPQMHVDLGDYRFLSARRGSGDAADYLDLMISHSAGTGFVHVTLLTPVRPDAPVPVLSTRSAAPGLIDGRDDRNLSVTGPEALRAALETTGSITLDDLYFETGSTRLGNGPFPSLDALAAYLAAHPDRRVTLVGHSDAEGSLQANIALSQARARAVLDVLARDYDIPPGQLDAQGVGFLAPRDSNLTDDGRTRNRRVEAILSSVN